MSTTATAAAPEPSPERNQECRRAVRDYLALRSTIAQSLPTIHRRLSVEWDFSQGEIASALNFLTGTGEVSWSFDRYGSTKHWQITHQGVLAHERGE